MKSKIRISLLTMFSVLLFAAIACTSAQPPAAAEPTPTQPPAALPETPTPTEPPEIEMVEVLAPIDSVQINIAESFPPQYFVQVVSGLPSGCAAFERYDVQQDGNVIDILVYNMEPAPNQEIACTLIYGFKENNIPLGTDFEGGVEYTVNVNDKTETFVAQATGEPAPETAQVPAPIESVNIEVDTETSQADLIVVSGLPDSCYEFDHIDVGMNGETVTADVINTHMTGDVMCAEVYRTVENRVTLDRDIQACEIVNVSVNGEFSQVQAIAPNIRCAGWISKPSPILTVEIKSDGQNPPSYTAIVVSTLPKGSSCSREEGFEVDRDGNTINVTVTHEEIAQPNAVCTADLPSVTNEIPLGSDFEPDVKYTVNVNGEVTETFVAGGDVPFREMASVPAPIESIEIIETESGYTLIVVSRQPRGSSCSDFEGYQVDRDGNTIRVAVHNLEVTEPNAPCTRDLPVDRTEIDLGNVFLDGESYTVIVNYEATETFVAGGSIGTPMIELPAPIDDVEVRVNQSTPPQYSLVVTSALRNGCVERGGYNVQRDGNTINVVVTNFEPAAETVVCTLEFRLAQTVVPLGSDFVNGQTYTVKVNDFETTFVAGEVEVAQVGLGEVFPIGLGEIVAIESEGLEIAFTEVLEDSRCPADVVCVWEGQVRIMIEVASTNENLGEHELYLESVREDRSTVEAGDYLIQLRALNPNPAVQGQFDQDNVNYVATLVVFKQASDEGY